MIYGSIYLALGLFAASGFANAVHLFPLPVLGVILAFEGLALMRVVVGLEAEDTGVALLVGLIAAGVPYGYLIGIVVGVAVVKVKGLRGRASGPAPP